MAGSQDGAPNFKLELSREKMIVKIEPIGDPMEPPPVPLAVPEPAADLALVIGAVLVSLIDDVILILLAKG